MQLTVTQSAQQRSFLYRGLLPQMEISHGLCLSITQPIMIAEIALVYVWARLYLCHDIKFCHDTPQKKTRFLRRKVYTSRIQYAGALVGHL